MFHLHLHDILFMSQWVDITVIRKSQIAVTKSPNSRSKETIINHLSKYSHLHNCMRNGVK